jgi:hypothetical protein
LSRFEEIFDTYNRVVEKCHEDFFRTVDGKHYDDNPEVYIDRLQSKTQECIKNWENTSFDELEGLTPVGLLNRIDDFEQIAGLFEYGARIGDNGLPDIFIEKLKSCGEAAANMLISLAADKSLMMSDEDMGIPLAAIELLGKWKSEKTVIALLDILYGLDEDNELFMEAVRDTLADIGSAAVELLVQRLENAQMIGGHEEYLLMALANIGESIKSDRIYRCLKSIFSRMNNKVIGVICLGNYGDGRAVPALRGYLQKNADKVDSITFCELKSAVEKLGGSIDDIDVKPVRG